MGFPAFELKVNPLFLLVFLVFAWAGLFAQAVVAFSLVFLHELVHWLIAARAGYRVRKIELFPFGGMAEYDGLLEMEPGQEIKVALVGPLFNLVLALLFYLLISRGLIIKHQIVDLLYEYNLLIGCFNLLPALPLDGGRILRALLVQRLGFQRGSIQAVRIAKTLAVIGGIIGVIVLVLNRSNIWFVFMAFFVYGAASQERKQLIFYLLSYLTHRREFVRELRVKEIDAHIVKDDLSLKEVLYSINPGRYNLFFALDQRFQLAGILTESQLITSFFAQTERELSVSDLIY